MQVTPSGETVIVPRNFKLLEELEKMEKGNTEMAISFGLVDGADVLILATEWNDYRNPNYEKMASLMKRKLVLDGRNALSAKRLAEHGFERYGVGIPSLKPNN